MMELDGIRQLARELQLAEERVVAAARLLAEGNTVPFIARYRKEATGGLDEIALRAIEDGMERAEALAARKVTVLKSITEQGLLTPELQRKIAACTDLRSLEDLYLPFKPKRRTRATIAREQGLQPLADLLLAQQTLHRSPAAILKPYIAPERGVPDADTALQGGLDIVAEQWSENAETRSWLLQQAQKFGRLVSKVKRGKKEEGVKFEAYFEHSESVAKAPGHRVLAMLRGVDEGFLNVSIELDPDRERLELRRRLVTNRQFEFHQDLLKAVDDCYERLLLPAVESATLQWMKERADDEAIAIFGKNLRELLMAAPAGPRVTLGIDPGFRTGCKIAVVDGTGKFLDQRTIYPTPPTADIAGAGRTLLELINKHQVELIAIGNGTASRETDAFVSDLIRQHALPVTKAIISESGASIYSASDIAIKEFPDLDVTVRGAISIARRLQDPLSELVKTDPKSIGVGQYQHDVNQVLLRKCLDRVVESCVNLVGVDLNMASEPLLSYVAGIGPKLAANVVAFRNQNGRFTSRQQLLEVPKLGKKAFEQAAGFLRIREGQEPLDNSAVHPEAYELVTQMAKDLGISSRNLVGNLGLSQRLDPNRFVNKKFGLPTVVDIIAELGKPGRDPRSEFRAVKFHEHVNKLEDLTPNLVLEGVVTNVTHFGAFVDIGVHQDGLIHISQLSNEFVKDPNDIVSVGDLVRVKVLEVDVPRKRISLTRKF
jgi:uncharacterized protein